MKTQNKIKEMSLYIVVAAIAGLVVLSFAVHLKIMQKLNLRHKYTQQQIVDLNKNTQQLIVDLEQNTGLQWDVQK